MRYVSDRHTLARETLEDGDVALELGVFRGDFTEVLLEYAGKVIAIDSWSHPIPIMRNDGRWSMEIGTYNEVACRFHGEIKSERLEIITGTSPDVLGTIPDKSVDWVYIDASHDYQSVLNDLEAVLPKTRKWICGHDYCWCNDYGVVRAVAVFCDRHGLKIDVLTNEPKSPVGCSTETVAYNSYAIRVPAG